MSRRGGTGPQAGEEQPEVLPIVQLGSPVLRARARDLTPDEIASPEIARLVEVMRTTMHEAPGVGLAAPQIGVSLRLAVIEDPPEFIEAAGAEGNPSERSALPFTVLVNPSYEPVGSSTREFFEGCLSMDGYRALVPRHHRVRARWTDLAGKHHNREFSGWPARIVQHEIDHLDGIVYVDRMEPRSLVTTEAYAAIWCERPVAEVRRTFNIGS